MINYNINYSKMVHKNFLKISYNKINKKSISHKFGRKTYVILT